MGLQKKFVGANVIVKTSGHQGASDYIGQQGKIVAINAKLAHAVLFEDGEIWYYQADDLGAVN